MRNLPHFPCKPRMGRTPSTTHPGLTSRSPKSSRLKWKTPLRAGLCVEFERKNNDLNDINEIKEIKESLLNILKIFHLFNLFRLLPYGLCRRDCKSSLSQREDLGGNVSMGVVSHLFFVALWAVLSGLQVLPFAKGGFRRECEYECECQAYWSKLVHKIGAIDWFLYICTICVRNG